MNSVNVLVCIKRVPDTGARLELTPDQLALNTKNLGFTISPHEECAVEEAVQIIERLGGSATVLTLGPPAAEDVLLDSLARGMDRAILLENEGKDFDPSQTAIAIVEEIRRQESEEAPFDLLLFGNEAADSGDYQVGVRVACSLGLPCATGIKKFELRNGRVHAAREITSGWETFELPIPSVLTVREGLNLPRHPSLRGTMMAKRKPLLRRIPKAGAVGIQLLSLKQPPQASSRSEILGEGPSAVPRIIELLEKLEVLNS